MYSRKSVGPRMKGTHLSDWICQSFMFLDFYQPQAFVEVIIGHKWLYIVVRNRSWLLNSSKATNLYNHPCYNDITLTPFEEIEISRSKSNSSSSSIQKRCWIRKLVFDIVNKVHYLVLFFLLHRVCLFFILMPFTVT